MLTNCLTTTFCLRSSTARSSTESATEIKTKEL